MKYYDDPLAAALIDMNKLHVLTGTFQQHDGKGNVCVKSMHNIKSISWKREIENLIKEKGEPKPSPHL